MGESRPINLCEYFGRARPDIVWGHAVNSQAELDLSLGSAEVHMIEADVKVGRHVPRPRAGADSADDRTAVAAAERELLSDQGAGSDAARVIMAHDLASSDLALSDFLAAVAAHNSRVRAPGGPDLAKPRDSESQPRPKGIKLDFKDPRAVSPALRLLAAFEQGSLGPVWLNADVLAGPGGHASPFAARDFVRDCSALMPGAELSIGWTTGFAPVEHAAGYTARHVDEMLALCDEFSLRHVTFPVRASMCTGAAAWRELARLLCHRHSFTLTFWGFANGHIDEWLRNHELRDRFYVDTKEMAAAQSTVWHLFRLFGANVPL